MRILHVITGIQRGGAEHLLLNGCELISPNHELMVVYLKGTPTLREEFSKFARLVHVPLNISALHNLIACIKEFNPDVIHTHLLHADLLGGIAASYLKVPHICTMHNIKFRNNWIDRAIFAAYRILFKATKGDVISISSSVQRHVESELNVPNNKSHLIYNAIPNRQAHLKPVEAGKHRSPICKIIFAGRLTPQKSVHTLLEAVSKLPNKDYRLTIIGDGPEKTPLEILADELGIRDTTEFLGELDRDYLLSQISQADIFVLPSVFEGFGIVILEAFQAGTPVISTSLEGPLEIINNGVTGILVPPADPRSLAVAIDRLINNPGLRANMANAAKLDFERRFSMEIHVDELERVYSSVRQTCTGQSPQR